LRPVRPVETTGRRGAPRQALPAQRDRLGDIRGARGGPGESALPLTPHLILTPSP
jgi:hypothetical protein